MLGACLDRGLVQAMPRLTCKCCLPPLPTLLSFLLTLTGCVTLSKPPVPSGHWFPHLPNGDIGRDGLEGATWLSMSVSCEPQCPRQTDRGSSLPLLGLSPRAVDGKGPAAHRIKYLSCWAKNWVSCSHRAVCMQGIRRAPHGP